MPLMQKNAHPPPLQSAQSAGLAAHFFPGAQSLESVRGLETTLLSKLADAQHSFDLPSLQDCSFNPLEADASRLSGHTANEVFTHTAIESTHIQHKLASSVLQCVQHVTPEVHECMKFWDHTFGACVTAPGSTFTGVTSLMAMRAIATT